MRGKITPWEALRNACDVDTAFAERFSTPTAASLRNNMLVVDGKGLWMFRFVMDPNVCEGMFGIKTITSRKFEPHDNVMH